MNGNIKTKKKTQIKKDDDAHIIAVTRRECGLIWLALEEYKFQRSRDTNFRNKNKISRMCKRFEKLMYKTVEKD